MMTTETTASRVLSPTATRAARVALLVAVVVVALVGAGIAGRAAFAAVTPGTDSADAGFARDMSAHHAQAVDMAEIIRGRTTDQQIRTMATDVSLTQTAQMGQMQGWLSAWGLPYGSSKPPMTWMDGGGGMTMAGSAGNGNMRLLPDGRMPGMATQTQVNQLRTLSPRAADVLFLELMIPHHRAGVHMAQAALQLAGTPAARTLATGIISSQQAEITQMRAMLAARRNP